METQDQGSSAPEAAAPVVHVTTPAVDTQSADSAPTETTEQKASPAKAEKPWWESRIGKLTRQNYEKDTELARLRFEREQWQRQQQQPPESQLPNAQRAPQQQVDIEALVEERAASKADITAFNAKCNAIYEAGKEIPGFSDSLSTLQMLGLVTPESLKAVFSGAKKGSPEKVLHHLGSNPELAAQIFSQSPVDIAADIAELRHQLDQKPAVSNAPLPLHATKANGGGGGPAPNTKAWYDAQNKADEQRRKR